MVSCMNPFPICLLLSLGIVTSLAQSQEFIDNYDMNGDYAKHVYRVEGVRVWNQYENGYPVRGWGARETGKEGTLVLRYVFDKAIVRCSLRAYLHAWFDETDRRFARTSEDRCQAGLLGRTNVEADRGGAEHASWHNQERTQQGTGSTSWKNR